VCFICQSVAALESARKVDLTKVVSHAQEELNWIVSGDNNIKPAAPGAIAPSEATSKPKELTTEPEKIDDSTTPPASAVPTSPTQTFFSRLQASIPPNLVSTVQSHLPEQLRQADLAQIRTTITAQAEEVRHRGEGLLREAVEGGREFFKDAVRVVPPEEAAAHAEGMRALPGMGWDGADVWMMDAALGTGIAPDAGGKGKEKEVDWSSPREARQAVATRAQALLKRLKYDPEVLKVDPEKDNAVDALYKEWVKKEFEGTEGGIDDAAWTEKIAKELEEPDDGQALKGTMATLGTFFVLTFIWERQ
jgi:hypothetical protein